MSFLSIFNSLADDAALNPPPSDLAERDDDLLKQATALAPGLDSFDHGGVSVSLTDSAFDSAFM